MKDYQTPTIEIIEISNQNVLLLSYDNMDNSGWTGNIVIPAQRTNDIV